MPEHPLIPLLEKAAWTVAREKIRPGILFFEEKQRSIENWICIELGLQLMTGELESRQVRFEMAYPEPHQGRCDLVLGPNQKSLWVEVAHIWAWTQSKWNDKCRKDMQRLGERLKGRDEYSGLLLLFLCSRPGWYQGDFENWVETERKNGRLLLIEPSASTE